MGLIIVNALILGLETSPKVMELIGWELALFDQGVIIVFCIELGLRIFAKGREFFRDPWGIFDFIVVAITLVPSNEALAVLRALRVLRVFRLVSTVPRLRRIVVALLHAVPGVGSHNSIAFTGVLCVFGDYDKNIWTKFPRLVWYSG